MGTIVYSFIQQIVIAYLLCIRRCSRTWSYMVNRTQSPCSHELTFIGRVKQLKSNIIKYYHYFRCHGKICSRAEDSECWVVGSSCFRGGSRISFLEGVTFDQTWGRRRNKPHRNLAGVHLGTANFMCKGPEAGRVSLGVGDRKANRATAKLVKQKVEEMRHSLFLAPRLSDFYLLNVSPIHFPFSSSLILYLIIPDFSPCCQLPSKLSSILLTG